MRLTSQESSALQNITKAYALKAAKARIAKWLILLWKWVMIGLVLSICLTLTKCSIEALHPEDLRVLTHINSRNH